MKFSLKSIGSALKKVVTAVNPVSHALYGAASGKGVTDIAKDYATDAGRAAAGAGVLGAGYLAAPAIGGALGGGAAATGGATAGLGGLGGGLLKSIGSGLLNVAPLALGAVGAVQSAKQAAHGQALEDEALQIARDREAQFAPLRDAGIAGALKAYTSPVSPLAAVGGYVDRGNPYSVAPGGGPPLTSVSTPGATPAMLAAESSLRGLGGVSPLLPGRRARARGAVQ